MRQLVPAGLQIISLTALSGRLRAGRGQDARDHPPSAAADDTCKRASFKVLIDVGHTPDDPGAISAHGNPEYSYNLASPTLAMEQLVDAGFRQTTCC